VGRNAWNARRFGVRLDELPHDFFAQALASDAIRTIQGPENVTIRHAGRTRPRVDRHFDPSRHRRSADPSVLSNQIDDAPAAVALLKMGELQRGTAQSASEEYGQDGAVAQSPKLRDVRRAQ
jgi:hypothetical protein